MSYKIDGVRRVLKTSASRRYLVVSVYDGRPKVEASFAEMTDAERKLKEYRTYFGVGDLFIFDQTTETVSR